MAIPKGPPRRYTTSRQLIAGDDFNNLNDSQNSSIIGITALAGGGKAGAPVISGAVAEIAVCATNADSVLLPPGYVGLEIFVANKGAANANILGSGNDTINGQVTANGVTQNAGVNAIYRCTSVVAGVAAAWFRVLSA